MVDTKTGDGESETKNGERGTGNEESLKGGILKKCRARWLHAEQCQARTYALSKQEIV